MTSIFISSPSWQMRRSRGVHQNSFEPIRPEASFPQIQWHTGSHRPQCITCGHRCFQISGR